MSASGPTSGRAPWIPILALLALMVGIGIAYQQSRPQRPAAPPGPSTPLPGGEPGEEAIDEALRQATPVQEAQTPIDSTAFKQRWLDEIRGIDITALDPGQRERFVRFANAGRCTCGCGYTLAACRASDMTCEVSGARLEGLRDSILAGHLTRMRGIRARPRPGG